MTGCLGHLSFGEVRLPARSWADRPTDDLLLGSPWAGRPRAGNGLSS